MGAITFKRSPYIFGIKYGSKTYGLFTYTEEYLDFFYCKVCIGVKYKNKVVYIPCLPVEDVEKANLSTYKFNLRFYHKNKEYCFLLKSSENLKSIISYALAKSSAIIGQNEYSDKFYKKNITISCLQPQLYGMRNKYYIKDITTNYVSSSMLSVEISNEVLVNGEQTASLIGGEYTSLISISIRDGGIEPYAYVEISGDIEGTIFVYKFTYSRGNYMTCEIIWLVKLKKPEILKSFNSDFTIFVKNNKKKCKILLIFYWHNKSNVLIYKHKEVKNV